LTLLLPAVTGSIDLAALTRGEGREALLRAVLAPQIDAATTLVPPHFYVNNGDVAEFNVDLAARTLNFDDRPTRAVLVASREYLTLNDTARRAVTQRYRTP
jgi:hypothetical protein